MRNGVHIQCRRVGGQDGPGFHHFIEFFEHLFFDTDFFENRFDHQVCVFQILIVQGGAQQVHALLEFVFLQLAFFDLRFIVAAKNAYALVQRFLLHFKHLHWNTGIEKIHADTATHGACTDDRH